MKSLGANAVLTEAELRVTDIFKSKKLPQPKLAFNCVSGQNALEVLRHLGHGGVMVTYGGMSREPVTVPTASFIFKVNTFLRIKIENMRLNKIFIWQDLTLKGFWMTAWNKQQGDSQKRKDMFEELGDFFKTKSLKAPPHKLVPFEQYKEAVLNTLSVDGKTGVKYIIDMTKE